MSIDYYSGTSLSGHIWKEDTSINRKLLQVPNTTFVYLAIPEIRTPHYSGHFILAQRCPDQRGSTVQLHYWDIGEYLLSPTMWSICDPLWEKVQFGAKIQNCVTRIVRKRNAHCIQRNRRVFLLICACWKIYICAKLYLFPERVTYIENKIVMGQYSSTLPYSLCWDSKRRLG